MRAARELAFADDVWWYALVTVLPFVILLIGVAALARVFDRGGTHD